MITRIVTFVKVRIRKFFLEEIWLEDYVKMGMVVGKNCSIQPGVVIDYSHCWLIKIGNNVTIAPQAYLLAHDASTKSIINYTKIGNITIEDNVFIGARALIMPGVTIGKNSIIGAGSIVTKSIPADSVAVGNPAKVVKAVDEYIKSNELLLSNSRKYDASYTHEGHITPEQKYRMYQELSNEIGFVL
ncbi:acyltransferase [Paenibacillus oryzisoli]|uniref:acyltransferase n=1 Tax=Paenibacillus oryzisoli TaxID=1850517 RepID=UPI000A7CFCF0|nr:acyltransferase [Paenibacillus oryzisoli]